MTDRNNLEKLFSTDRLKKFYEAYPVTRLLEVVDLIGIPFWYAYFFFLLNTFVGSFGVTSFSF